MVSLSTRLRQCCTVQHIPPNVSNQCFKCDTWQKHESYNGTDCPKRALDFKRIWPRERDIYTPYVPKAVQFAGMSYSTGFRLRIKGPGVNVHVRGIHVSYILCTRVMYAHIPIICRHVA